MTLLRSRQGYYVDAESGLVLRPVGTRDTCGYIRIDRRYLGEAAVSAHRVIWETAHESVPPGMVVNHINGIKDDNRLVNLEVVTSSQNSKHAYATGLASNQGEKHPSARLTEDAVRAIRRLAAAGAAHLLLGEQFGVSRRQINDIVRLRSWAHVPVEV